MIFKKLLSVTAITVVITSSSFKLNTYGARAAQKNVEQVQQHTSTRQKILNETGISVPIKVPREHVRTMYEEAKRNKVPLTLLMKLIERESKFDSKVINKNTGARGYMQLMPSTYRSYCKQLKLERNPINNIKIGTFILKEMYDIWDREGYSEHRKWKLALASYNAGIDKVIKIKRVPEIKETKSFVKYILE